MFKKEAIVAVPYPKGLKSQRRATCEATEPYVPHKVIHDGEYRHLLRPPA